MKKPNKILTFGIIVLVSFLFFGSLLVIVRHENPDEDNGKSSEITPAAQDDEKNDADDSANKEETPEKKSKYYSKKTIIGQAACNERGEIYGGEPGDQTEREVRTSKWSSNYGWIYVFRHKDPKTRLKIARYAMDICKNQNIGYNASKPNRYTAWDIAKDNGYDFKGISEPCDTTCSQLISMVLRAVGTPKEYAPRHMDIAAMTEVMPLNPDLIMYQDEAYTQSSENLLPGDILLSSHHTAIVVKSPNAKN